MAQTTENYHFFDKKAFSKMKQKPFFINAGRGTAVEEDALAWALDSEILSGAALDVLESNAPDLKQSRLVNRDNVIITPHAAFYSKESIDDLRRISSENLMFYLEKKYEEVHKVINMETLN